MNIINSIKYEFYYIIQVYYFYLLKNLILKKISKILIIFIKKNSRYKIINLLIMQSEVIKSI